MGAVDYVDLLCLSLSHSISIAGGRLQADEYAKDEPGGFYVTWPETLIP
jgi:hypothetical protein